MNQKTNEKLNRFIRLLEGIFELNKADLDFGIYRIMNIRKDVIKQFFADGLPQKVNDALAPFAEDTDKIKEKIADIEKQAAELEIEIAESPKLAGDYALYKTQLAAGADISSLETDVYSALYSFFNRYYDEGDFISKRRYKEGVYAIPYEGEEVKLYWANADQYYIKTAESFRDYTFTDNGKKIHFCLLDATTEKNNNKESDTSKRVFMLATKTPEKPDLKAIEDVDGELFIRFIYDVPADKRTAKQNADENLAAITDAIQKSYTSWYHLLAEAPTAKNGSRTIIQKHLEAYVAKNTFDYFIHKNLHGFLNRELDFFIKNEVIHLEDLDTTDEKRADCYLAKARAIKRVGKAIIDFLSQIEDFQKKLWLKKKFVVSTNWCVTLDHIEEIFYGEIIANAAQIAEWKEMYAIDEIEHNLTTAGYSEPLTVDFLRQNGNLVLDTRHFAVNFKDRLIGSIDNLDEHTGGLLIHSENFQALQLMQEKYRGQIKCVYIDPPYNAQSSEIPYKNTFKHSSWLSLMQNRLQISLTLLRDDFVYIAAIDEVEQERLGLLLKEVFNEIFAITAITIVHNPSGQQGDNFSSTHEYAYFVYSVPGRSIAEQVRDNPDEWDKRNLRDVTGAESLRTAAKTCFYPILVKNNKIIGFGDVCAEDCHPQMNVIRDDGVIEVYPIDPEGTERKWRFGRETVEGIHDQLFVVYIKNRGVYDIRRLKKTFNYKTVWQAAKYSANNYGTQPLNQMFGYAPFAYPKSINTVYDCVSAGLNNINDAIILDYFAGSGTTGHAVLSLNRADSGSRKYILVEMGEYFNTVTLPRMKKVIYSSDWRAGKPKNRNTGVSHILKYVALESYEDTLTNIELDDEKHRLLELMGEDYMLRYMLNYEAKESTLSLKQFNRPFNYQLKINENNETKNKSVDLCETFNFLIGLTVIWQSAVAYYSAVPHMNGEYKGAVQLEPNASGEYGFKQIEGRTPNGNRALIIWRTVTKDSLQSNAALDAFFSQHRRNPADRKFDVIYVNGDNNLENLRLDDEIWKVQRIEPVFKEKMFEVAE